DQKPEQRRLNTSTGWAHRRLLLYATKVVAPRYPRVTGARCAPRRGNRLVTARRLQHNRPDHFGCFATMPILAPPTPSAMAAGTPWRVLLIGSPCLVHAQAATKLRLSPKDAALLAIVALDGPVTADHAAALI